MTNRYLSSFRSNPVSIANWMQKREHSFETNSNRPGVQQVPWPLKKNNEYPFLFIRDEGTLQTICERKHSSLHKVYTTGQRRECLFSAPSLANNSELTVRKRSIPPQYSSSPIVLGRVSNAARNASLFLCLGSFLILRVYWLASAASGRTFRVICVCLPWCLLPGFVLRLNLFGTLPSFLGPNIIRYMSAACLTVSPFFLFFFFFFKSPKIANLSKQVAVAVLFREY
jgi:hypothetical protein